MRIWVFCHTFSCFLVLCHGLPGGCCDCWLIDHSAHLLVLQSSALSLVIHTTPSGVLYLKVFKAFTVVLDHRVTATWSHCHCIKPCSRKGQPLFYPSTGPVGTLKGPCWRILYSWTYLWVSCCPLPACLCSSVGSSCTFITGDLSPKNAKYNQSNAVSAATDNWVSSKPSSPQTACLDSFILMFKLIKKEEWRHQEPHKALILLKCK